MGSTVQMMMDKMKFDKKWCLMGWARNSYSPDQWLVEFQSDFTSLLNSTSPLVIGRSESRDTLKPVWLGSTLKNNSQLISIATALILALSNACHSIPLLIIFCYYHNLDFPYFFDFFFILPLTSFLNTSFHRRYPTLRAVVSPGLDATLLREI